MAIHPVHDIFGVSHYDETDEGDAATLAALHHLDSAIRHILRAVPNAQAVKAADADLERVRATMSLLGHRLKGNKVENHRGCVNPEACALEAAYLEGGTS